MHKESQKESLDWRGQSKTDEGPSLDDCGIIGIESKWYQAVTVTVTVTDYLLKHELQKSLHRSPVVSRLLRKECPGLDGTVVGRRFGWKTKSQ
jgi:hypothetical protein